MSEDALAARLDWMRSGTVRFLETAEGLRGTDLTEPSALEGWTRAHVLAHVAQNATALGNLVTWARTGVVTPMYGSAAARDAAIEQAVATTSGPQLIDDVRRTADQLDAGLADLPEDRWAAVVTTAQGREVSASLIPWMRVREVWIHAIDLLAGPTFDDIPPDLGLALIRDMARLITPKLGDVAIELTPDGTDVHIPLGNGTPGPTVTGSVTALVEWLSGRRLPVAAVGGPERPELPAWL